MEEGFVGDISMSELMQQRWATGKPMRVLGMWHPAKGTSYPVTTRRCCSCGFLEACSETQ